jgi:hypothetical protein
MNALLLVLVLSQDAQVRVNERDVVLTYISIEVTPTGDCLLKADAEVKSPSVAPIRARNSYKLSAADCDGLKKKGLRAAKLDMRKAGVAIGDGKAP